MTLQWLRDVRGVVMAWWTKSRFRKRAGWWPRAEAKQAQAHGRKEREEEATQDQDTSDDPSWWLKDES